MIQIHHIGYLVKNIKKAKGSFVNIGFSVTQDVIYDPYREVDILFMEKDGYTIELVMPKSDTSVVAKLIKSYKNTPYHICYLSDNFEQDILYLSTSGFTQIDTPTPAPAFGNRKVCFFIGSQIGLIELLEKGERNICL